MKHCALDLFMILPNLNGNRRRQRGGRREEAAC